MKRILLFFSALMLSCIALWAHDVEIDGIYYNLDETNKTAEVTYGSDRYNSPAHDYAGSITIPETITYNAKTYSVTSIGQGAFGNCSELTEVTIPNSVTVINPSFYNCSGLTSITIPNSVTVINAAFQGCSGLTSITIPKSVTDVVLGSFSDCTNLKTLIWNAINGRIGGEYQFSQVSTVIIGNEVQSIPSHLFCGMKIKEVTIPNSVTSIGNEAFKDCSNLTSITIPESVTYIGDNLFKGCSGLKSVVWNAKNCADFIFDTSNYYEHAHIYPPFYDSSSSITSFIFGNEVEHIPAYLCYGMSKLSEVTIPNSVTSIGKEAFYNCSGLTKVNYLGTVDKWVEFDWDNSNNNPTYYAKDLYINNELLTDVKITTADSIKKYTFYNCKSIKSVEIGNSVTSIGQYAFLGCSGLTSVTIPNSVTSIGEYAFLNCSGLTKVNYLGTVDKWVEFDWNYYNSNPTYYAKDLYTNNELLTDVKITEADSIKNYAFYNCQSIKSVEIGNSVTYIGYHTFYGCSGLSSVIWNARKFLGDADESGYFYTSNNFEESPITSFTIGEGVERIPDFLCPYLKNLTEIIIPSSVTSIGSGAFYRSGLTSLTIPNSVTSIDSYAFDGCENLTKVNYLGTVDKWVEFDWDNSNNNPTYYAKDLYINNELLTEVKITTADSIKKYAFYNCKSIKSVEIGNSITSIHTGAFYGCENLKKLYNTSDLNITKGSTEYGYIAYYADLVYVYKEDNFALDKNYIILDYLGDYNQTTIELPAIAKGINPHILSKFTNLTSITIGSDVANLNLDVFNGCNNLKEINVSTENPNYCSENGVLFSKDKTELIIYPRAKSDASYNIPNTVTSIAYEAFKGCINLTSITIPNSIIGINTQAFEGCENLKTVCNLSDLNITKGSIGYGYVGYYADLVYTYKQDDFVLDKNYIIFDYLGDYNQTTIELPAIAKGINPHILSKFTNLTSITIGNDVANLNLDVFSGCNNLKEINISTENPNYCSENGVLFSKDKTELIKYPIAKSDASYNIPNTVTSIGSQAFAGCRGLSSITIPKNVTYLGDRAFLDCTSLSSVEWNAITCNDQTAPVFKESPINQFTFGNEVQTIPAYLCSGMSGLDEITIPNTVTTIGASAFYGCNGFTSLIIPKNVSYISNNAFYGCNGIKSIEWNAVSCSDLIAAPFAQSPVENVTFGNEVQRIPAYLCSGMSGLNEITIPNTVTTISAYAFSNCSNITSVIVPNKVSLIAEGAFNNCSKLTNIILGQNVSMIENYAFSGCRKVREVTSYAEVVPETGYEEIFENYNANLYVPCDALEDYYYDVTFGSFKDNSQCMSAEEVQTGDKVEIEVDDRNNATVTWPSNKNAKKYNLVISKDGEVVCTLYFNRDGRLNSIDFKRSASAEQEGFKFTVTGLEGASQYGYLMSAIGEADNVIEEHIGNFTTNGLVDIIETLADANITISNGLITCPETDFAIYNTIGQDVTSFNGSLQPGVYLVSIENDIVKVMIK